MDNENKKGIASVSMGSSKPDDYSNGISLMYEIAEAYSKRDSMVSLADSVDSKTRKMMSSVKMNDDYYNSLLAIGSKDPSHFMDRYSLDNDTLNWMLWTTLYSESWVFRRAIDKPAQDEISPGIYLRGLQNEDVEEKIYEIFDDHKTDLIELLMWGALYGGSVAVLMFDGIPLDEMDRPIDFKKINRDSSHVLRMYVTDRWYGCAPSYSETVTNFKNIDFGKPMYYDITFADGKAYRIHHSFILRYDHRMAPKFIKNGQLSGWGYAEGVHILNELMRDDKLKSSIQSLIDKSCIEIIQMPGMRGVFMGGDPTTNEQLKKRLDMVNWARNFNSLTFLDKDDTYSMNGFSGLSGLADILQQNMWLISAALEMQGVLYGHLNNGFSGDEDALERYNETLAVRKETYVRPVLNKFFKILFRLYDVKGDVKFFFKPLSLMPEIDSKKRVEAVSDVVDLVNKMMSAEYLTKEAAAETVKRFCNTGDLTFSVGREEVKKQEAKEALQKSNNISTGMELGSSLGSETDLGGIGGESGMPEDVDLGEPSQSSVGSIKASSAEGGGGEAAPQPAGASGEGGENG